MSAIRHAMDYLFGLGVFGFVYWILNGIRVEFQPVSETGTIYDWANYMFNGAVIIYLIFGAFWFFRVLKEWQFEQQGGM